MSWRSRWRADLARPEEPTGHDELPYLMAIALTIVAVAQLTDPGTAVDLLVMSVAVLGYLLRGLLPRMPAEVFAALVLVPMATVVADGGRMEGTFFLGVTMVLFTSWHLGSLTRTLLIVAITAALPWAVANLWATQEDIGWEAWTSASIFTSTLGRVLHKQGLLIGELERARGALAEQAVAEERRRIARELHDLAGHTLAAVLLHVTGARHVLRRDVDDAERALLDAETVGRASLDQIRATVAALRTDERGTDPALAGSADLMALADEYRRAGLAIATSIGPRVADLGGPVGTALHRIAREALANVARHAPTNRVALAVDDGDDEVRLVVTDHGTPAIDPATGSGHFGIVGMRERARALGGDLDAGPTADGWQVEARLPLRSSPRDEHVAR